MKRESIRIDVCAKWVIGALALAVASACYANSTLVGGGSILPVIGYAGNSSANPVYPAGTGSLFGVYSAGTGIGVSYCKTSDDIAQNVFFENTSSYNVQGTCPNQGFGAGGEGRTDLTQPNYLVLDMPLNSTDYVNYQTINGSSTYPTQFPAMVGSIGIALNLVDSVGNQVTSSEVNFTDAQLCDIFSDTVTNWNDSRLASAFTLPPGVSIPSEPIYVQYRSDNTGTTLALSNHLSAVCPSYTNGLHTPVYFQTSQNFTNVVTGFPANSPVVYGILNSIPSGWAPFASNALLADAIADTLDSIGYVETTNTLSMAPDLQFADVNGLSPTANFGSPLIVGSPAVVYNEVINAVNASNGTPVVEAISTFSSTPPPTGSKCIVLVQPSYYAKPGVKGGVIPTGTYPIVAMTYLLANAQGVESTDLANVQALVDAPYNSTITGSVTNVGSGTGLAFLSVASSVFSSTAPGTCVNSGE
jgi:phosphate transport system substrate-binding protein